MKKIRLLLAAAAAMFTMGVSAQSWTAPTIAGEDPVSGTKYKIMNVGAGQFLDGGSSWYGWTTSSVLTSTGLDMTLTDSGSGWTIQRPDNGYTFISGAYSGKGEMHVDGNNTRASRFFEFVKQTSGYYHIRAVASDATYGNTMADYESKCWGWEGASSTYPTAVYATVSPDAGFACDWVFIQPANVGEATELYQARLSLYNEYLKVNALGVNTDDAATVYNNASATVAEINAATAALYKARRDYYISVATEAEPQDLTEYYVVNPDFSTKTADGWTLTGTAGNQQWGTGAMESWNNSNVSVLQELTDLPNGRFRVSCDMISGNDTKTAYVYAKGMAEVIGETVSAKASAGNYNTMSNEVAGKTVNAYPVIVGDHKMTIGFKDPSGWVVVDNFRILYYGPDLTALKEALQTMIDDVPALEGTTTAAAYNAAKTYADGIDMAALTTEGQITSAATALSNLVDAAKALQTNYARYNAIKTSATTIATGLDTTTPDADVAAATTNDAVEAAIASLRATFLAELPKLTVPAEGIDVTAVMVDNASVRQNTDFWTSYMYPSSPNGGSFAKCANNECEFYQQNFKFYQTLALTSGTWEFGVTGFHRAGNHSTYFYAGEDKILIPGVANTVVNTMAAAETYFDGGNGKVALKFLVETAGNIEIGIDNQDTETDKWTIFRDFTLKYFGAPDYSIYQTQWSEAADAADVALTTYADYDGFAETEKNALTTARANAPTSGSLKADYLSKTQALKDATAAYVAKGQKYQAAKAAIDKANAIKDAHNFASADAITTFAAAIKAISDKYDDKTLTQEEAADAGKTLGVSVSGVRANPNGAAVNYMENGFGLTDFEANLYINTWSVEGETDGSDFKVPFYEYWVSDGNSLGEKIWTGTLTDLPNGQYKVSALIRVRAKNGTAAADAEGISIDVNGGAAVDVTEGTQIGESQFTMATFEALGLVKDGTLKFNVNVAAGNNISWLSFKDVKYTKERDLTPEEAAVAPTAIALYNGETEVTEPVALDATTATVTLTPNYTPAHATEGYIEWATSDASVATVADGVVTAVSSGTATITATSTLAPAVSATVTVTVSFPESEYASNTYVNDGATRTTVTLGENLIKNGSFEYPNALDGWKTIGYTTDAVAGNATVNPTGGVNGGAYITTAGGGVGSEKTLRRAIAVEVGKKYYFAVSTSGKAPDAKNFQYNALFKMSDATTETGTIKEFEWPQGASNNSSEWSTTETVFTAETPYVGVRMGWNSSTNFDNFVLAEVTSEETVGNVQYALDAIPTANVGTGAFQYSQAAIDAANALVQGTATVADVQAAYDALQVVNAPADGQLFHVVLTYDGWTYDNKAMTYLAGDRSDMGGYNIKYQAAANTNLAQAFTFTKVSGNNYKMSQIDADGNARYICTGVPYNGNTGQIRTTTTADDALQVEVIPTATEGVWNLKNTAANNYIGSQDAGVFTVNSHIDFNIVETTKPSIAINTTAAGWGTTILPFAVPELPTGVKAYTCAEVAGTTLTLVEVTALEANKPYIIEGAWDETLTGDAQGIQTTYTVGLLTGVYTDTPAENGTYILQNHAGEVAFYLVNNSVLEKVPNVPANHAYLTVAGGVKAFYLGEATAIEKVMAGAAAGEIYDLAGRKVSRMVKGNAYIIGGRKVVVK